MKAMAVEVGSQVILYQPERRVSLALYCVLSGRTQKAVRRKIEDGRWVEGREYFRDPDGSIVVDRHGADKWVTGAA